MPEKKGRPVGQQYPWVRSVRFSGKDADRLKRLAAKLEQEEADVIRLALRRLAAAEGIE